ncbi:Wzz/FepE/Etk N-terminal domain-containing protein [Thermodesulfobacteriota bacterium]
MNDIDDRTKIYGEENNPYPEEDEINLVDLLLVILKHKWLIFMLVFLTGVGAVFYSLSLTNIYRSEAMITPREEEKGAGVAIPNLGGLGGLVAGELGLGGGGSLKKLEMVLNSRYLSTHILQKYKLMPVVFVDLWDASTKAWLSEEKPTEQDGVMALKGMLKVGVDIKKDTITVGFEHKDPATAQKIVSYYLTETSELIRQVVLKDAAEKKAFFYRQTERIADPLLKEKIYLLLAKEIEKETFARVQKYYSFYVVDPPIVPDLDKKVRPRRSTICILSVIVALFVAVFLAFFIEFVKRVKAEDPQRYHDLIQALKPWRSKK